MCGCATHHSQAASPREPVPDALVLNVENMTCGHCASTIIEAVEAGLPGAEVQADSGTKLVAVRGVGDLAGVEALILGAGYAPTGRLA